MMAMIIISIQIMPILVILLMILISIPASESFLYQKLHPHLRNKWSTYNYYIMGTTSSETASTTASFINRTNLIPAETWYSDPCLTRANHVPIIIMNKNNDEDDKMLQNSRFLLLQNNDSGKLCHLAVTSTILISNEDTCNEEETIVQNPLFLTYDEIQNLFLIDDENSDDILQELIQKGEIMDKMTTNPQKIKSFLIWLGHYQNHHNPNSEVEEYFAIYINTNDSFLDNDKKGKILIEASKRATTSFSTTNNNVHNDDKKIINVSITSLPLREFGDQIQSSKHAAICSLANGLTEFQKSHLFCSYCGSPTKIDKYGSSRQCSNSKRKFNGSCSAPSIYPRIDNASIMLITSPCENYALLGRKKSWPKGRYSTLAGFLEIGETLEQCCVRETFEESGVQIDLNSIRFVKSQPWPFPRSVMVGFRAKAKENEIPIVRDDTDHYLPNINFDRREMEDVKWFHKDFVAQHLDGGSTALECYKPKTDEEEKFHIPGKASLARYLITSWALEE